MGASLRRSAFSPNIRERRDYSCAVFDQHAQVIAMGDHMPVHLGSMPMSVRAAIERLALGRGDIAMVNAIFGGPARQISYPRAVEHRLSRRAPEVDARPADKGPFDERGFPPGVRESLCERISPLSGADDDCVVLIHVTHQVVSEPRGVATGS